MSSGPSDCAKVGRWEGCLQQNKEIALGIVQLDKGGWVEIHQADVGSGQWRIVHLKLVMNARVLWKQKNSDSVQDYSQFAPVPATLNYRHAIQMLRASAVAGR